MNGCTKIQLLAGLALLASACSAPPVPEVAFEGPHAVRPYLQAYLDAKGGPPSISLAVAVDGEIVLAEAAGWADLDTRRPATPETSYRTYSISKGVTAIAVMKAVEDGLLSLDDDIRRYVPELPEKPWTIRVDHLLTHTSGIRHYKENAGEISSTREWPSLADSLVVFADDPLEFEPGTGFRYSSFGFNLLTGALEGATGLDFGDYLEKAVLAPAGMASTTLAVAGRPNPDLAVGYWQPWAGYHRELEELPNVSGKYGSSGVVSTPSDLVRLFLALDRDELLDPETIERMLTVPRPDLSESQARGWNVVVEDGRRVVYRTGGGIGYTGIVEHFPDHGVTGAVLINQAEYPGRVPILGRVLAYYVGSPE